MHKLITWFFNNLNNLGQTLSLICSFFIMTTVLYWLETIVKAQWNWLNFAKPIMDTILNFANSILPFSINLGDTALDGKFIIAIILLLLILLVLRFIIECISNLKDTYDDMHRSYKKAVENNFNRDLKNKVIKEEKQISKYMILIKTRLQKKFTNCPDKFSIPEQNSLMNDIIFNKTGVKYEIFENGFLYNFDNFNKIDDVLDVIFKIKKSSSPLDYAVCIQAGENFIQLKKLADLENFGKIIFCADTLLRYKCNNSHRYGTQNVGIFQTKEGSIEVHEFQEIL